MILIALAIVFGGIGALSLSKSDSADSSAPASGAPSVLPGSGGANIPAGSAPVSTSSSVSASATASSGNVDKSVQVRVFNNSSVSGLAAKTAQKLEASGWNIAETGNYSEGEIPKTTVYYGNSSSEKQAANAIAAELGVSAEPRFAGIANSSPGVIVIVTAS